jgi:hypothetical protein
MTVLDTAQTFGDVIRGQATAHPHKIALQALRRSPVTFETLNS